LEWKSGKNTEDDQLSRYAEVTGNDLSSKALLPTKVCSMHDICIVGRTDWEERLKIGAAKFRFPLVVSGPDSIWLSLNEFKVNKLTKALEHPGLKIEMELIPLSFVPFNESSELWEVAQIVIPEIIKQMVSREPLVLLEEVCKTTIRGWQTVSASRRPVFRNKVHDVLREASSNEFKRYLSLKPGAKAKLGTTTWEIKNNPLDLSSTRRSREFRRLKSLQQDFVLALRTGRRPSRQEEMFE
jgi:hypothetical protein